MREEDLKAGLEVEILESNGSQLHEGSVYKIDRIDDDFAVIDVWYFTASMLRLTERSKLLLEAFERYPVGTKFRVVHKPDTVKTVLSHEIKENIGIVDTNLGSHINIDDGYQGATICLNGEWAEIVSMPDEVKEEPHLEITSRAVWTRSRLAEINRDIGVRASEGVDIPKEWYQEAFHLTEDLEREKRAKELKLDNAKKASNFVNTMVNQKGSVGILLLPF